MATAKFITTFFTNVTIDFKVTRVTAYARFRSVHIIPVITCVTEVTKLPAFTDDPFATTVTLLTMFLVQQSNHAGERNREVI